MTMSVIRLVMADDHEMVLHGVKAMLSHFTDDVEVVGMATNLVDALALVTKERPDVLLCDIRLGKDSGLDLCLQAKSLEPSVHVVFLMCTRTSSTCTKPCGSRVGLRLEES